MEPPRKQPPRSYKGSSNPNIMKKQPVVSPSSGDSSSRSSKRLKGKKFDKAGISSGVALIKGKTVNSTKMQSNQGSSQLKLKSSVDFVIKQVGDHNINQVITASNPSWTAQKPHLAGESSQSPSSSLIGKDRVLDEALMKLRSFKQFDTVEDHSDHHYAKNDHLLTQESKMWAKRIQEEWKILERDLPDTILVRVYESRMDILRAVIKGADGTPYHDGLFFFDVFFPSVYPFVPPHVYYHAGGLRLNPNLFGSGHVCLSLLDTWRGNDDERWIPEKSTMLQVLVSIQGLVLNSKPYFNEAGYDTLSGTQFGETESLKYNESAFILSLKTMSFTMRKPPKHFEEFVAGHFCQRAQDILAACGAYMDGARVGSLVKGRVQDLGKGRKSCSDAFKKNVASYTKVLVTDLKIIGAEDCQKFLESIRAKDSDKFPAPAKTRSKGAGVKVAIIVIIFVLFVLFLSLADWKS